MVSPPLGSGYYNNMPGSASTAARTPKTPHGMIGRAGHNPSPSLDGVMSLENVWQVWNAYILQTYCSVTNTEIDLCEDDRRRRFH